MEPFASNLRRRAEQLGISQAEAARRVGLSERRFGNYVGGRREPDLAMLVRIAHVLGTSPDELLSFGSDAPTGGAIDSGARISIAIRVLSPADLDRLAVMVEALAAARSEVDA